MPASGSAISAQPGCRGILASTAASFSLSSAVSPRSPSSVCRAASATRSAFSSRFSEASRYSCPIATALVASASPCSPALQFSTASARARFACARLFSAAAACIISSAGLLVPPAAAAGSGSSGSSGSSTGSGLS